MLNEVSLTKQWLHEWSELRRRGWAAQAAASLCSSRTFMPSAMIGISFRHAVTLSAGGMASAADALADVRNDGGVIAWRHDERRTRASECGPAGSISDPLRWACQTKPTAACRLRMHYKCAET